MASRSPLHLLLWPLSPAQGHLSPMLALAERLLAEGRCIITCVLTQSSHRRMLDADAATTASKSTSEVRFEIIPDAPDVTGRLEIINAMVKAMEAQQSFLEGLIERSKSSESPICCIVSDMTLSGVAQDVGNKCNIPHAVFWTSSAASIVIGLAAMVGGLEPGAPQLKELEQKLHMTARPMLDLFPPEDQEEKEQVLSFYRRLDEPSHILINTFDALEGHLIPLLPPNVRFIGPCLPPNAYTTAPRATSDVVNGNSDHEDPSSLRFGSMNKEDMTCLSWLDKQVDCSVLFVSFGSAWGLPQAQILQIALGVEASNHKFIWVARQDNALNKSNDSPFPEGFLERTKDRGLFIPWAPQLQVLKHRAIGGFLTHCGWNSTLESIVMGVPMICFPILGDQPIDAEIIVVGPPHECMQGNDKKEKSCSLGLGFDGRRFAGVKSNYVVTKEEVNETIRSLFGGDVGIEVRKNIHQLKDHARRAIVESSHATLCSFIEDIHQANCLK